MDKLIKKLVKDVPAKDKSAKFKHDEKVLMKADKKQDKKLAMKKKAHKK